MPGPINNSFTIGFNMGIKIKYRAFSISLEFMGIEYIGIVTPITHSNLQEGLPTEFSVVLNGSFRGIFTIDKTTWQSTLLENDLFVSEIGKKIYNFYE